MIVATVETSRFLRKSLVILRRCRKNRSRHETSRSRYRFRWHWAEQLLHDVA